MSDFLHGMALINLVPPVAPSVKTSVVSAWEAVGAAFQSAGNNIRTAINEQAQQAHDSGDQESSSS
jgi:hypothetical protein